MDDLADEIRRVEFEIPEPFEDIDFWPLGIVSPNDKPFRDRIDRILVVSPFVDDSFASELAQRQFPMYLLSRGETLARLQDETLKQFGKVWILDDTATPEPGETEQEGDANATLEADGVENHDIPLVGLHAKVYVVDAGRNASVFTGSANATAAAFHRNVEFLVQLCGKKSCCGIDA
ncbi:MAG TPA: phospholipase D family protein, partial [Gemmataceae bacterium]|nr:phospholipase D family protein [Gemmataceae bacterium]